MVILVMDVTPKALSPIEVRLLGRFISLKCKHPSKAPFPIEITRSGIFIF